MYSLISFDKCTHPCNYHLNKDTEQKAPPAHFQSLLLPTQKQPLFWFLSPQISVDYCWALSKQNPTICTPLCLASFAECNVFEIHPCSVLGVCSMLLLCRNCLEMDD